MHANESDEWFDDTRHFSAYVDNTNDYTEVNASACSLSAQVGECTLRNAVAYCSDRLRNDSDHCTVYIPPHAQMVVKSRDVEITTRIGNMTVMGAGCTIRSSPSVTSYALFRVNAAGAGNAFHFNLVNMTIDSFGNTEQMGGAVWLGYVALSFLRHVTFKNCKGRDGGALDLSNTNQITVSHCRFVNNYCVGNGGGFGFGEFNEDTVVEHCQFVDNSALELGHVGGGFGGGSTGPLC